MATNCNTIKIAKAPTELVTGNIATFTILKLTWNRTGNSKLLRVLLKNQVIKKVVGTMNKKFIAK